MAIRGKNVKSSKDTLYRDYAIALFLIIIFVLIIFSIDKLYQSDTSAGKFTTPAPQQKPSQGAAVTSNPPTYYTQTMADYQGISIVSQQSGQLATTRGYIVQFKEKSLVEKKTEFEQEINDLKASASNFRKIGQTNQATQVESTAATKEREINQKLAAHKQIIADEHVKASNDIKSRIGKLPKMNEYSKVFNGVALNISASEAEQLKKSPYVKAVYENRRVNITLMDSVPLINADDVWQMKDAQGRNITGQNVTIAIIDTGVDYTHLDLGGCYSPPGGYCGDGFCNQTKEDRLSCPQDCETTFEPGWPVITRNEQFTPVVANIDSDPEKEVLVYAEDLGWDDYDEKLFVFNHDGTAVNGFPKKMYGTIYSVPLVEDIDNDGKMEILLSTAYNLHVFRNNGSYQQGFPTVLNEYTHSIPAVADLNKDGKKEIIVGTGSFWGNTGEEGKIYVFDTNGNYVSPWPKSLGEDYRVHTSSPVLGDIDGDGKLEIVHGAIQQYSVGKNDRVYAWNDDGTLVNGFPVELQSGDLSIINEISNIILSDADGDGKDEIFVVSFQGKIYGIDGNGKFLPNWPKTFDFWLWPTLVSSDINNDGKKELLFARYPLGSSYFNNDVYAFNLDGSTVLGWPKFFSAPTAGGPAYLWSFNVGDINYDGQKDIIVKMASSSGGHVYAFDQNGSIINGWPKKLFGWSQTGLPISDDIDNDGNVEVLVPESENPNFLVYEQKRNQTMLQTSTRITTASNTRSGIPAIDAKTDARGFQINKNVGKYEAVLYASSEGGSSSVSGAGVNTSQNCKVIGGYDIVNNDDDPMDDHGHGTHVAATAAGNGALKGVAPDAKIHAYKVLDSGGSGYFDWVIAGIERAVDPNQDGNFSDHADIISMSLGGDCGGVYNEYCGPDDPVSQAIDNAVSNGVVATIAAGNCGPSGNPFSCLKTGKETIQTPGTARKAITVGAVFKKDYDENICWLPWSCDYTPRADQSTGFSSRGPVIWDNGSLIKPDVVAPGAIICAAEYDNAWSDRKCLDDKHVLLSGTSMATPHVAGAVALIKQAHPDWTPDEIKMALRSRAKKLGDVITTVGYGRIDIINTAGITHRPCIATINIKSELSGIVNITGTAACESLSNYTILYQYVENSNWVELYHSRSQINSGILYSFDTAGLNNGKYLMKLVVRNAYGDVYDDNAFFNVKNFYIEGIGNTLNYIKGYELVKGKIVTTAYNAYKVEYQREGNSSWNQICYGARPVSNDIICSINVSSFSNGVYYFRLSILKNSTWMTDVPFRTAVVRELLDNWPVEINVSRTGIHAISDIDNDGFNELIQPTFGICGTGWCDGAALYIFDKNGTSTRLDKFCTTSGCTEALRSSPSVYYDKLEKRNLIALSMAYILGLIDDRGNYKYNWPFIPATNGEFNQLSVISDLGLNQEKKIFASYRSSNDDAKIFGFNKEGTVLTNFPINVTKENINRTGYSYLWIGLALFPDAKQPRLGSVGVTVYYDANNQRHLKQYFDVYSYNGSFVRRTYLFDDASQSINNFYLTPHASGDLKNDGDIELVVGSTVEDYRLVNESIEKGTYNINYISTNFYVINRNGSIISRPFSTKGHTVSFLALGDLGYGKPAIVAMLSAPPHYIGLPAPPYFYDKIVAFDYLGNILLDINVSSNHYLEMLTIGDVDGDGESEIIVNYRPRWWGGQPSGIEIYNKKGVLEREIEIPTFGAVDYGTIPIITDFNGDGKTDITLTSELIPWAGSGVYSTRIYALNLGGGYDENKMDWPTFQHDNQRTGCYKCENTPPKITKISDTPDPAPVGSKISVTVYWNDTPGDKVKIHVCKTNAINATTQKCIGISWCDSLNYTTSNPTSCSYTTTSADVGVRNYYAFACDDKNACSSSSAGTFGVMSFMDVLPTHWAFKEVEAIYKAGITSGCSLNATGRYYCPNDVVKNDQMAIFLVRAMKQTPYNKTSPTFIDVYPTHPAYGYVERLYQQNVTNGCRYDSFLMRRYYCPNNTVTRANLSILISRAAKIPIYDNPTPTFADVNRTYFAYKEIEGLYKKNITQGCRYDNATKKRYFCPTDVVTRDQMAVFLSKAFSLSSPVSIPPGYYIRINQTA